MDIQKIKYFLSVAEYLSFSKAAQEQYVAQSTITTQVQAFEDAIGVKLFNRNSKKVELTEAGKILQADMSKLVDDYELSIRKAKTAAGGKNTISFGCTRPVDWMKIPKLIRSYCAEHQDTQFDICTQQFARLTRKLVNGSLDVIFVDINYIKNMETVRCFPLYTDHLVVILPADHKLAEQSVISPKELSCYRTYMMGYVDSPNDHAISAFDQALLSHSVDTQKFLRVSSREEIINAVSCGSGIGIIPQSLMGDQSEYIISREIDMETISCPFVCAYTDSSLNNPAVAPFLEYVKQFYSDFSLSQTE